MSFFFTVLQNFPFTCHLINYTPVYTSLLGSFHWQEQEAQEQEAQEQEQKQEQEDLFDLGARSCSCINLAKTKLSFELYCAKLQ